MSPLAGKRALVTGGAAGIGAAICARLAADGASVIVADLDVATGEATAQAVGGIFVCLDVTDDTSWTALETELSESGLDILVNNAGINPGPRAIEDTDFSTWRRVLGVNLDGAFLGCRAGVRLMKGRGGNIINIGSAAGVRAVAEMPAYSASKAALHALTKSVAVHCGRRGYAIRCNAVLPGSVETPMVAALRSASGDPAAARARAAALHPIGFVGAPEDIANAVAWLAGPEARFVTGALFSVDGGLTV